MWLMALWLRRRMLKLLSSARLSSSSRVRLLKDRILSKGKVKQGHHQVIIRPCRVAHPNPSHTPTGQSQRQGGHTAQMRSLSHTHTQVQVRGRGGSGNVPRYPSGVQCLLSQTPGLVMETKLYLNCETTEGHTTWKHYMLQPLMPAVHGCLSRQRPDSGRTLQVLKVSKGAPMDSLCPPAEGTTRQPQPLGNRLVCTA